jgi:uncharacterized protein (TIGR02271 family)
MSNISLETATSYQGRTLIDSDGDKVGRISDIYVDEQSGAPEWAVVNTGLFGTKETFVPLRQASEQGDQVAVPYQKAHIKDAPGIDPDGQLSESEEAELYRHYGFDYDDAGTGTGYDTGYDTRTTTGTTTGYDAGTRVDDDRAGTVGRDVSGPETDQAMTRSEEELEVGTRRRERGRVRLRKHVVTENVTTTVPVQREEVRLEREPITDANADAALRGGDITEEEHEVTLREEEPVVEKRVVPKERVRLDTETVTEEREVGDELRKERIDYDGDVEPRGDDRI